MKLPRILFVLPVRGGSGGANSVVQEVAGLVHLGIETQIAVNSVNYNAFLNAYPEATNSRIRIVPYSNGGDLASMMTDVDIVVGTVNTTMAEIADAQKQLRASASKSPRVAYYVQDYEPLFFDPYSPAWKVAFESYNIIPDAVLFAKTEWLCRIVYENHGVRVFKVEPSIDHDVFYPNLARKSFGVSVTALLRPQTPRRAPRRTIRILEGLASKFGKEVSLSVFGCTKEDLQKNSLFLPSTVEDHGILRRTQVPILLRNADMFIDLSDFQAFGRTGLEGMASGCVPLLPVLGGTSEYARHLENAYVVDTRNDQAIFDAVGHFITLTSDDRMKMRMQGLATAARYSILKASLSELQLFVSMMQKIE